MQKRLNVCLLNDSFPPVIDGVANTVFNYAEIIEKNYGHSIVATPSYPDVTDHYSYPVYRYPSVNTTKLIGYRMGIPFNPSSVVGLENENIDIIHSHCPVVSNVLARALRQKVNAPVILTYHTKFDIDLAKAVKSNLIQKAALKYLATSIAACDEVWAVSNGAGENMRKIGYEGGYIVMENGVDFPKGKVSQDKIDRLNKEHDLREDETIFLFVGRMMWYKGLKICLDGLKRAKVNGEKFRMIFIGDGADRANVTKYAQDLDLADECIFTGAIHDRELLRTYFSRCDLFLFASTYDTNGIVVREAAACGLASALIRNSCAAEGITDNQNGIFIDENAESMGAAIIAACRNREGIKQIGENAMNQIYLSWEDSVARAYDRYNVILERRKSGLFIRRETHTDDLLRASFSLCEAINKAQGSVSYNINKAQNQFTRTKDYAKQKTTDIHDKINDIRGKR